MKTKMPNKKSVIFKGKRGEYELSQEYFSMTRNYAAYDINKKEDVFIKTPIPGSKKQLSATAEQCLLSHNRELQILQHLEGLPVPKVIDEQDSEEKTRFMALNYVKGKRFDDIIQEKEGLEPANSAKLFSRICDVVEKIHQKGVVHRDLKPNNILIDQGYPIVIDFGISYHKELKLELKLRFLKTAIYASPDAGMSSSSDIRSDVYSLGVILYESLTGETPSVYDEITKTKVFFRDAKSEPSYFQTSAYTSLMEIVDKATEEEPQKRFQTAQELKEAVEKTQALTSKSALLQSVAK